MVTSSFDKQYRDLVLDIVNNGVWDKDQNVRTRWADGSKAYTKGLVSRQLFFDNQELPILTSKKVAWKTAIKEMLWIWQLKSNNVDLLNEMGVTIWDEWRKEDGTIGPAYGYQLGKKSRKVLLHDMEQYDYYEMDQVDYLLYQLQTNPASRRLITSLWGVDDLDEMALTPCVWSTQWLVKEGHLHLIVQQRSADVALGLPFNVFQYAVLQRMIAQVTGHKLGALTFNINDAHIYERHIDALVDQVQGHSFEPPTLLLNQEIKDFYDFTIEDFKLIGYKHGPKVNMEVAI